MALNTLIPTHSEVHAALHCTPLAQRILRLSVRALYFPLRAKRLEEYSQVPLVQGRLDIATVS